MSRQRAVQERIRRLDGLLKRSRKHQFACNAPALPACSLTGEESVTEAGVSFALCCSPVASGGEENFFPPFGEGLFREKARPGPGKFVPRGGPALRGVFSFVVSGCVCLPALS